MKIICHRGYWKKGHPQNSPEAFLASFDIRCGVELDVRDCNGQLVISHAVPTATSLLLESVLQDYQHKGKGLPLAINIKADGLQNQLKKLVELFSLTNYFLFDMSIPDAICYIHAGLPVLTRQSEYESIPSFLTQAKGIWLDSFESDEWYSEQLIINHLKAGKALCLVSPELHQRDFQPTWTRLKQWKTCCQNDRFMVCTDYPMEAKEYFREFIQ